MCFCKKRMMIGLNAKNMKNKIDNTLKNLALQIKQELDKYDGNVLFAKKIKQAKETPAKVVGLSKWKRKG
jgi:hypothetical protein